MKILSIGDTSAQYKGVEHLILTHTHSHTFNHPLSKRIPIMMIILTIIPITPRHYSVL